MSGIGNSISFYQYFQSWLVKQEEFLEELTRAASSSPSSFSDNRSHHQYLNDIINRVVQHYELYYRTKSMWAKDNVLSILSPPWMSLLEHSFLWVGGFRPSTAVHLLYSKCGQQLEAQFDELISGHPTGDLGNLSSSQLARVDELQMRIIKEEKAIAEKIASHQETVAEPSMVELSQIVTQLTRSRRGGRPHEDDMEEERVGFTISSKEEGMRVILQMADDLRLRTIKSIIEILSPIQAVHFLIAAAQLHLRLHDWGKKRDDSARHMRLSRKKL